MFYFIKDGIKSFFKNAIMSFASVGILCACLVILGVAISVIVNINSFIDEVAAQNEISVYLDFDLEQQRIDEIKLEIEALPNANEVWYVSKEEGLATMINNMVRNTPENRQLFEDIEANNPLPNAYHLTLINLEEYDTVEYQLGQIEGIQSVNTRTKRVSQVMLDIRQAVSIYGSTIIIILAAVSVFIISNTIKLTMFTRRLEIGIMKDVGATDWFIRWPFLIEGMLIGGLSATLAFFIVWYQYVYAMTPMVEHLDFLTALPFKDVSMVFLAAFYGAGLLSGLFGSIVSIKKYLHD